MVSSVPDWELFAAAPSNHMALSQLFERHRHYVFRVAWALLGEDAAAEDAVQEVFLRLQSGRLRARPEAKFTTWLYRVALNIARELARKRRRMWGQADATEVLGSVPDATSDPARVDRLNDLARSLALLPLRQREVVVLRLLEGFDTSETAEILGCREGTVKAHLHRATLKLRDLLRNDAT
ncbi:MAG: sigma-70 family RNA polymerase sigma factor [Pseudomonadota bacterium]